MDVLLGVAVLAVAFATIFMTVKFRAAIRGSDERLEQVTARLVGQMTRQVRDSAERAEERRGEDRREWSGTLEAMRVQARELDRRISRETAQLRASLDGQDANTNQIKTDLKNEVNQRNETIRARHAQLRTEIGQLTEAIKDLRTKHGQLQHAGELLEQGIRRDLTGLRASFEGHERAIERLRQVVQDRTAAAGDELAEVKHLLSGAQRELRERCQHTESAVFSSARDISCLHRGLSAVQQHIRQQLDWEVAGARDTTHPLMIGGVFSAGAAAADILPLLYENFCGALTLQVMLREVESAASLRFYLRWGSVDGTSPEEYLETLLNVFSGGNTETSTGLSELRSLVAAVFTADAAALRVGPMVISCLHGNLLGAVLDADEQAAVHGHQAILSPEDYEATLRSLQPGRTVELTPWAARCGSA